MQNIKTNKYESPQDLYDKMVNDKIKDSVAEVFKLCYKISTETQSDVFFDYAPHVKWITIRIFLNSWGYNIHHDEEIGIKVDNNLDNLHDIEDIICKLQKLYNRGMRK